MNNSLCKKCGKGCKLACVALNFLVKIYSEKRVEEKTALIHTLRPMLRIIDWEVADDLRDLAEQIIDRYPELAFIRSFDIKVGYVRSFESKNNSGRATLADCRKVTGPYQAYLPFDFVITFYEPNLTMLTDNQRKVVMLHELMHITLTERGLAVKPHDIEDWENILSQYGLKWNQFGNDVPDILAGGEDAETKESKKRKAK